MSSYFIDESIFVQFKKVFDFNNYEECERFVDKIKGYLEIHIDLEDIIYYEITKPCDAEWSVMVNVCDSIDAGDSVAFMLISDYSTVVTRLANEAKEGK